VQSTNTSAIEIENISKKKAKSQSEIQTHQ